MPPKSLFIPRYILNVLKWTNHVKRMPRNILTRTLKQKKLHRKAEEIQKDPPSDRLTAEMRPEWVKYVRFIKV